MKTLGTILGTAFIIAFVYFTFIPSGRETFNEYVYGMKRIDQEVNYRNRKMVEDTARSMIANYEFAKGEYETYKMFCEDSKYDNNKCQRALDSKTSANKTASTYNNYILKNKYLFQNNLPSDIYYELLIIE